MFDLQSDLASRVRRQMVATISKYKLLENGDHVMVCVSGGKDSTVLLASLAEVQRRAPIQFSIGAVLLDQKQPGFQAETYTQWVKTNIGIEIEIIQQDTYSIVKEKTQGRIYCALCSRLRRGILYEHAVQNRFTKVALGHHREDAAETLMLNMFYSGKLQAMPPKFKSDDGRNIVIRPLLNVAEADVEKLKQQWSIPTIPCNLCGSQDGLKRKRVKALLQELESEIPFVRNSIATAIGNVRPSHLADDRVWDFQKL